VSTTVSMITPLIVDLTLIEKRCLPLSLMIPSLRHHTQHSRLMQRFVWPTQLSPHFGFANSSSGLVNSDTGPTSPSISNTIHWRPQQVPYFAVGPVLYVRTHATTGCMDKRCSHPSRVTTHHGPIIRLRGS
jgi:hypothetical protein